MPEKQKKTIRELTLMLMYLTSWEERDTPEMRAVKKKELENIRAKYDEDKRRYIELSRRQSSR